MSAGLFDKNGDHSSANPAEAVDASAGLLGNHGGHSSANPAEAVDASATSIFGAHDETDAVNQTTKTSALSSKAEMHRDDDTNPVQ